MIRVKWSENHDWGIFHWKWFIPMEIVQIFFLRKNLPCKLGFLFEEQYNYRKEQRTSCRFKWQVLRPYRNLDAETNSIQMPFSSPFNMSFFRTGNFFKWGILAGWTLFIHLSPLPRAKEPFKFPLYLFIFLRNCLCFSPSTEFLWYLCLNGE